VPVDSVLAGLQSASQRVLASETVDAQAKHTPADRPAASTSGKSGEAAGGMAVFNSSAANGSAAPQPAQPAASSSAAEQASSSGASPPTDNGAAVAADPPDAQPAQPSVAAATSEQPAAAADGRDDDSTAHGSSHEQHSEVEQPDSQQVRRAQPSVSAAAVMPCAPPLHEFLIYPGLICKYRRSNSPPSCSGCQTRSWRKRSPSGSSLWTCRSSQMMTCSASCPNGSWQPGSWRTCSTHDLLTGHGVSILVDIGTLRQCLFHTLFALVLPANFARVRYSHSTSTPYPATAVTTHCIPKQHTSVQLRTQPEVRCFHRVSTVSR
jgi:hypothetical protein